MNCSQWQEWQDVGYVTAFYGTIYGNITTGHGDRTPSPSQATRALWSPSPTTIGVDLYTSSSRMDGWVGKVHVGVR